MENNWFQEELEEAKKSIWYKLEGVDIEISELIIEFKALEEFKVNLPEKFRKNFEKIQDIFERLKRDFKELSDHIENENERMKMYTKLPQKYPLIPCPFCSSEPDLIESEEWADCRRTPDIYYGILCSNDRCMASDIEVCYETLSEVVINWCTRDSKLMIPLERINEIISHAHEYSTENRKRK